MSEEDLRDLCFYLDVDYDSLRGEGKPGKARELINLLRQRGRVQELVQCGRKLRSDMSWGSAL